MYLRCIEIFQDAIFLQKRRFFDMELQLSQEQAAEVLASLHETRGTWTELHINRKDGHGS